MTTNTEVKVFQNITGTDAGVPQLSGTAGALITVLDACLVNGYGSVTLDSLVVASNVATCTKSTGHGFTALGTVGPVIRISGATPSGLNTDWRITVVSSTVFTFVTTGISDQTATGTIDAKRAPAGFSKEFSATNKAAYRSDDVTGTRLYLRVDDTDTRYPTLIMYESMSDVDTGTGPAPTTASLWFGKSNAVSSAARKWILIADGRLFYLLCDSDVNNNWYAGMSFGDINSYKSGDTYCGLLKAHTSAMHHYQYAAIGNWGFLARNYTSTGSAVSSTAYSHGKNTSLGVNSQSYPAPADTSFHAWPVEVWEATNTIARGLMPGLWNPIHAITLSQHGLLVDNIPQLPGRTLMILYHYQGGMAFDIAGPWR